MLRLGWIRVFSGALLVFSLGACGDDDDVTPQAGMGGAGGASGVGGAAGEVGGADGASGMGGASGAGTGGMGGVGGDPYTCMPAPPTPDPGGSADEGQACCGGLGLCASNVSGAGTDAYGLDDCRTGADLKCVPNPALASDGDGGVDDEDGGAPPALASCRMMVGMGDQTYEGRCIPSCFLLGRATASLMQSTCDAESKCVPCYSPITGESTGACERNGDAPVEPAPAGFSECGDGNTGYCVPGGASGMAMLPQLTCAMGETCAPKSRVLDQGSCFARCTSMLLGPGACLPSFVAGSQAAILSMETCLMGELCIPCVNPLTMMPTRACN